ncbi:KilA-N domain-containing protein [Avibacterium paragallinarum]
MRIQHFFYNDVSVSFNENHYLNATAIAKHFDKFVKDYLKTVQTKEYINALARNLSVGNIVLTANDLVVVRQGGIEQGTWLHPKLAVNFARWLNADFAVWCDLKIDTLIENQQKNTALLPNFSDPVAAARAWADAKEREQRALVREQQALLENQQKSEQIASMESYFRNGISPFEFVKGLNGVNALKVGEFLIGKNWLYQDNRTKRVKSYARDQYLTEETTEISQHGKEPFIACKPVLLKKGAAKLYEWYVKGSLPMKANWNGEFTQDKAVGL